jgi:RimJ/RimL family protein N-acetyltransferase
MPELPPALTLRDDDLLLRDWQPADAPALEPVCGDPDVCRFTSVPWTYTPEGAGAWIARVERARGTGAVLALAIAHAGEPQALGNVNLVRFDDAAGSAALGYWLAPAARGRGLAARAARLLCRWGFEQLRLDSVELAILPENRASQRVAERLGARRQGLRRDSHEADGRRWDMLIYALAPEDLR